MRARLLASGVAALVVVAGAAGAARAASRARYYLALGDSLSQGQQPNVTGDTVNTREGYADQLVTIERRRIPGLVLVKLGCGGESTHSMLTGHGNELLAKHFHCKPAGGSQLKAAELFLRAHRAAGEVPLITIDLGANDIDGCANVPASQVIACITAGEASIRSNMPRILEALGKAAPKGTTFVGMTLYDPELAQYFSPDSSQRGLAAVSVAIIKQVNDEIAAADAGAAFRTADAAGAFETYDSTNMVPFDGQSIPANVARVCSWTWACTPPPRGPNIHANRDGYAVMAEAFAKAAGRLR